MRKKVRHILGISGGKDSTALAIYMRDKVPDMEYFFCDTGAELQETYDYLAVLEKFLGKPIKRLNPVKNFDYWLDFNSNFLPSPRQRWCTINLKLKPIEAFVGDDEAVSYVAIRKDEDSRKGMMDSSANIKVMFPFIDAGIDKAGVYKILDKSGVGLPKYYEWRSRSGCYFCFFQRKIEWVGLMEKHPALFERAKQYEKYDSRTGKRFTWNGDESLEELSRPERVAEIKKRYSAQLEKEKSRNVNKPLHEVLEKAMDEGSDGAPCLICHL